ncbi:hypothetical protein [Aliiruegeria sabulilitoris]|uniref:hypothetical protein n=1 Tax=Aliiruegeria sabulilitoris TaxID=1510458 RepID=UPI000833785B|nr:hypothetical protein [Aliiruegeria sabulilitoris]NDR58230.1 hypothetical protein [Pseudoruegeria sp. M32A2M]
MKRQCFAAICVILAGNVAWAEKFYGTLVSPVSGAGLPAAFEIRADGALDYCFQDVETNCYPLPLETLEAGAYRASVLNVRSVDGVETRHTNIWTWAPIDGGYHGRFEIQIEDGAPELKSEGDFFPR